MNKIFQNHKIVLYGRGAFGTNALFLLNNYDIKVLCFADRDKEKQGYFMDGVDCISYEDALRLDKSDCIIIICLKKPDEMVRAFKDTGFYNVITFYDMKRILSEYKEVGFKPIDDEIALIELKDAIECAYCGNNGIEYEGLGSQLFFDLNYRFNRYGNN